MQVRLLCLATALSFACASSPDDLARLETFRDGQAVSASFTAGGTSPPCTGLYCQDNPIGIVC